MGMYLTREYYDVFVVVFYYIYERKRKKKRKKKMKNEEYGHGQPDATPSSTNRLQRCWTLVILSLTFSLAFYGVYGILTYTNAYPLRACSYFMV